MALAVIGGLLFSTMLSLVFVPAMFMLMDDVGALIWRFGSKLLASSGENEPGPDDHAGGHKPPPTRRAFACGGVAERSNVVRCVALA